MNKLKKSLALIATLAIASTAFVACGDDSSSSTADSSSSTAESSSSEGDSSSEAAPAAENKFKDDDPTLSILCWTDNDLKNMIKCFADNTDYTEDQVKYVNVGGGGEEARDQYVTYFDGDGDADLFVLEADWILDYINKDEYTAPLTELGFAESDFDNGYAYVKAVGTNEKGVIKGSSWQATPGGYVYRTDLAEKYLGAKTPDEMQDKVKDWDTFTESAKTVKEQSNGKTAMADTLGGMWQVWQYNRKSAWVDADYNLVIDDFCKEYAELAKTYYDEGYVTKESQWSAGWNQIMQDDSTMGAFLCTWCFGKDGTLSQMEGNSEGKLDGPTAGKFNITAGPSGWAWGGSWLAVSPKCNTGTAAHDFVEFFTINPDTMKTYALYSGDFVNSPSAMKAIVDEKSNKNDYLGGQDQFSVLYEAASTIDMSNVTAYDSVLKSAFNNAVTKYVNGDYKDADEMIKGFKEDVKANVGDLTVE